MKAIFCLVLIVTLFSIDADAQGVCIGVATGNVRTRVGSVDGPFAGANTWGQFFAGPTTESLVPVGLASPHSNGSIFAGVVTVPGAPAFTTAFIQLVAWDSVRWGTTFAAVPAHQLGRTDIGTVLLTDGVILLAPQFTQPAIVPIPEPSAWALAVVSTGAVLVGRFIRRCSPPPTSPPSEPAGQRGDAGFLCGQSHSSSLQRWPRAFEQQADQTRNRLRSSMTKSCANGMRNAKAMAK